MILMDDEVFISPAAAEHFNQIISVPALRVFDELAVDFLNQLSTVLLKDHESRVYSDLIAFAFFCRRANIMKCGNNGVLEREGRLGRGIVFHVAPSNVPINFAYSLATGLLAGNINIVKVPSLQSAQSTKIIEKIGQLLECPEYKKLKKYIFLIRYDRSRVGLTRYFSKISAARMIWGGDETIANVRSLPSPPRGIDICFPDRYSLCVLNADKLIGAKNIEGLACNFYNDAYIFDQNACTSPHLIVWIGAAKNIEDAKFIFWGSVKALLKKKYQSEGIHLIEKFNALCRLRLSQIQAVTYSKPVDSLWIVDVPNLNFDPVSYRSYGGFFIQCTEKHLDSLLGKLDERYQTLSYYGFRKNEITESLKRLCPRGIDRVVPVGRASNFSFNWDGHNLINCLSRVIEIT